MISLSNVTKRFGSLTAVDHFTLTVQAGELFSLLGPNGAGKTTTIKMLTGLTAPDNGRIELNGYDILSHPVEAKKITGYIPDAPYLYNKLTGVEFLTVIGQLYQLPAAVIRTKIAEYRERLDMEDWFEQQIEGYSRGMKQRVAFAAAMIHEPKILIIDEPMVGLDPRTGRNMKQLMREKANRGTTVFLSTHNLNVAEELSDRIGIVHRGKLLSVGTFDELKSTPGETLEELFIQLVEESADDTPTAA
ncbi:MAG: ABC transporter ATP-binding protein [Fidelibacterota bacterium]